MFDLDYAILILNIFLLLVCILTVYKPVFLILGVGLSFTLITQIIFNSVETFTRSITILVAFLNSLSVLLGIAKNRGI